MPLAYLSSQIWHGDLVNLLTSYSTVLGRYSSILRLHATTSQTRGPLPAILFLPLAHSVPCVSSWLPWWSACGESSWALSSSPSLFSQPLFLLGIPWLGSEVLPSSLLPSCRLNQLFINQAGDGKELLHIIEIGDAPNIITLMSRLKPDLWA